MANPIGVFQRYHSLPCRALREVRRRWRWLRRRWSSHDVRFVFHDAYLGNLPGVPLDGMRAERILAFLTEEGLIERQDLAVPRSPSLKNLLGAHSSEYLESLQNTEVPQRIFGLPLGDAELEHVVEIQRLMVGGTIQATRLALGNCGVAVNLGGGFHHASRDEGLAFCVINDLAVAIARLRARGFSEPILVVDLDLHDGNGTRAIFANDPTVYTYSIHGEHWGSVDAVASTAIALGSDVTDETYLGTLLKTLPDVVEQVSPGLVLYVAGVDVAADDAIGNWEISADGILARDRFVMSLFRKEHRPVPVAVTLGGGYGDRAWRYWARFLAWLMAGSVVEPPANEAVTLRRFRRIWRTLDPMALTSDPDDMSFSLSEEDLVGIVPGMPRQTRFLRYFSRHGVELVLERLGIFDQLRLRGYQHPSLELELSHPQGQTLRIFSDRDRGELLMELRVDRSQRVIQGMEVLAIEWLLLQNPRAHFGPYQRPLPGQNHPGLGMLREVFGWLMVVCEKLELDGIYFVPSHYHTAAQSRRLVPFLEPEHEACYRRLAEAFEAITLAEASRLLDSGGVVVEGDGEPYSWGAYPMVLPVSDRLKQRVCSEHYRERVEAALPDIAYGLVMHASQEGEQ